MEETKTEIDIEENIWRREIFFAEEKQIIEGKEGKYLEKDKILSVEERRHGEGKWRNQDVLKNFRWLASAEFSPGEAGKGIEIISCCIVMFWAADKHY